MAYLLDTNFFSTPNRIGCYKRSICPGWWDWINQARATAIICSIKKVQEELKKGNDDLKKWATTEGEVLFEDHEDPNFSEAYRVVVNAVNKKLYTPTAKREFFHGTDSFLVGYALAYNHTVVTYEVRNDAKAGKVKIPSACHYVDVKSVHPTSMLENEKVQFVLKI